MLPKQAGWTVPVAKPGPATPRVAVPSLPCQLQGRQGTAHPAAGLQHVQVAQLMPSWEHSHQNTLPQVWELWLEEPREEPKRCL